MRKNLRLFPLSVIYSCNVVVMAMNLTRKQTENQWTLKDSKQKYRKFSRHHQQYHWHFSGDTVVKLKLQTHIQQSKKRENCLPKHSFDTLYAFRDIIVIPYLAYVNFHKLYVYNSLCHFFIVCFEFIFFHTCTYVFSCTY